MEDAFEKNGDAVPALFRTLLRLLPGLVAGLLMTALALGAVQWLGVSDSPRSSTGVNPGETYRMYMAGQLGAALERLLLIEVELKSTSANGEELLEQFVLELCYLEQAQ